MASPRQRLLLLAVLCVAATLAAAKPALFETFGAGWEAKWQHSSDDKYSGRFEAESPSSFADDALKVRPPFPLRARSRFIET